MRAERPSPLRRRSRGPRYGRAGVRPHRRQTGASPLRRSSSLASTIGRRRRAGAGSGAGRRPADGGLRPDHVREMLYRLKLLDRLKLLPLLVLVLVLLALLLLVLALLLFVLPLLGVLLLAVLALFLLPLGLQQLVDLGDLH